LKKYCTVFILLVPIILNSQTFKSYGLRTGYSLESSGWEHPDTLGNNYHNKAYISAFNVGLYGEFFAVKNLNTIVDIGYKWRQYFFQYDLGNANDVRDIRNSLSYITLSVSEKIKFDSDRWSIYAYGGLKSDYQIGKSTEKDIQNVFEDSKSFLFGATGGVGFAKRFSKFWRISFDIYFEKDLNKMYESGFGHVQNQEIGLRVGIGPYNPANK
jgi:hypothetical protein